MNTRRKLWLVLIGIVLAMTVIACLSTPTTKSPSVSMAGKWLDPDTSGTVTTIEERNGGFVVVSIINPGRRVNELTTTSYSNGVLKWEYCPESMHCIKSESVSVTSTTLTATWNWSDGGNGGTTVYKRVP